MVDGSVNGRQTAEHWWPAALLIDGGGVVGGGGDHGLEVEAEDGRLWSRWPMGGLGTLRRARDERTEAAIHVSSTILAISLYVGISTFFLASC